MKTVALFFAFLIVSGCVSHANSVSDANKPVQPTPTTQNSNLITIGQNTYSDYKYDKDLLDKLDVANERFRQTPDEFKSVDFRNFKYDFGRLEDGKFLKMETGKNASGGNSAYLEDVFYIDLIDDAKKEAVVFINYLSCGAGCDGGADIIYFYSSRNGKPQFLGVFESGANKWGCNLKSFTIKNKKISIEQFGRCAKQTDKDTDAPFNVSYLVGDETHSEFSIGKGKFQRESVKVIEAKAVNVMDSPAFISINE